VTHLLDGKSYQIYLQPAKPLLEADVLLLIRTPLVPHQQPKLEGKELLGA
jgi:hypothetical protein